MNCFPALLIRTAALSGIIFLLTLALIAFLDSFASFESFSKPSDLSTSSVCSCSHRSEVLLQCSFQIHL